MQYSYIGKYEVSLNLAMEIREGWNANNSIFDWGSSADTYTFNGEMVTDDYDIWDRLSSNAPSIVVNSEGFYPFGTHFLGDTLGKRYPAYTSKSNFHGDYQSWRGKIIPDSSNGYTYDTSAWVSSVTTGFGVFGLADFPVPLCVPSSEYSITYNRTGNVIREYDSGESSERRQFSMSWENLCGNDLRAILIKVITVVRSNVFTIDFGSNLQRLSPWLPREGELLSGEYDIRLSSPVINYTYTGGGLWDLTIEAIKWDQ